MNGFTFSRWIEGIDILRYLEKRGYQCETARMILYDIGYPKEEIRACNRTYLNRRFAWNSHQDYEYIKGRIKKWWRENDHKYPDLLDYNLGYHTAGTVARKLMNKDFINIFEL